MTTDSTKEPAVAGPSAFSSLRKAFVFMRPYKKQIFLATVALVFTAAVTLALVQFVRVIVDVGFVAGSSQSLGLAIAGFLVARSTENYDLNKAQAAPGQGLCPTRFVARDLFEMTPEMLIQDGVADKWLVDPPRDGAFALVQALAALRQQQRDPEAHPQTPGAGQWTAPKRIVYVSCNPSTLARDADVLVHQAGYACTSAGVINMFPHTAHVESMAVFERLD